MLGHSMGGLVAILFAVSRGFLDEVPEARIEAAERAVLEAVTAGIADLEGIMARAGDDDAVWERLTHLIATAIGPFKEAHADTGNTDPQNPDRP